MRRSHRPGWFVSLLLALGLLVGWGGERALAKPNVCKRSCSAERRACRAAFRTAFRTSKGDCIGKGPVKRQCVKTAQVAFRAAADQCRTFATACLSCCASGGTHCDAQCGDAVVASGEDCDPPGRGTCKNGATCSATCECAATTTSTSPTTTSSSTTTTAVSTSTTSTTLPPCGNGVQDGNETAIDCGGGTCAPCADGLACTGTADCRSTFCSSGICTDPCPTQPSGTSCTDDGNPCTVDACDGGACQHMPGNAGAVCRATIGGCDAAETCDGSSADCPFDVLVGNGEICRAAAGTCDDEEFCDGASPQCPSDELRPAGSTCRVSFGVCDQPETCTGTSPTCPADALAPSSTVCRAAAGDCDVAETCTGSSKNCPDDDFDTSGRVCRAATTVCAQDATCSGQSADCPANPPKPNGTLCRAVAGDCDVADVCDGTSTACPNHFKSNSVQCRPAADVCDVAENCPGNGAECPPDQFDSSGSVCRPASQACQLAATCDGSGPGCPANPRKPAGTQCRAKNGNCDIADVCDGTSPACPDTVAPSGTVCSPALGVCDVAETCNGVSKDCPLDIRSGDVCRPSAGPCDPAESCNGGVDCPADVKIPAGTDCGAANGEPPCELWTCKADGACSFDRNRSVGASCRAPIDDCDVRDRCGDANTNPNFPFCADDAKEPDGTACTLVGGPPSHCKAGVCTSIPCKYGIECPDGFVCTNSTCVATPAHAFGATCTGAASGVFGDCGGGLVCCAGMAGDGIGGPASNGKGGRCQQCCETSFNGPTGCGDNTCCDGKCTDVTADTHNCLGCAYEPGGIDCDTLISACTPAVKRCDDAVAGGCVMKDQTVLLSCSEPGDSCVVPSVTVPNPNCNYCDAASTVPGAGCTSNADCELAPGVGTCHHVVGRCSGDTAVVGAECTTDGDCQDGTHPNGDCWTATCFFNNTLTEGIPDCAGLDFTFCPITCKHYNAPPNVGADCTADTDCHGGTTCQSSCAGVYATLGAFCFSDNTCQY